MAAVIPFKRTLYDAALFRVQTVFGEFVAAGTLCGHIDFVVPGEGTYPLSPNEALALATMLQQSRTDVLINSEPAHDPRIVGG